MSRLGGDPPGTRALLAGILLGLVALAFFGLASGRPAWGLLGGWACTVAALTCATVALIQWWRGRD